MTRNIHTQAAARAAPPLASPSLVAVERDGDCEGEQEGEDADEPEDAEVSRPVQELRDVPLVPHGPLEESPQTISRAPGACRRLRRRPNVVNVVRTCCDVAYTRVSLCDCRVSGGMSHTPSSPSNDSLPDPCMACAPIVEALKQRVAELRVSSSRALLAAEVEEEGTVNRLLRSVTRLRAERAEAEVALQAEAEYVANAASRAMRAAQLDAAVARAERDAATAAASRAAALTALAACDSPSSKTWSRERSERMEREMEAEMESVTLRLQRALGEARACATRTATRVCDAWVDALKGTVDSQMLVAMHARILLNEEASTSIESAMGGSSSGGKGEGSRASSPGTAGGYVSRTLRSPRSLPRMSFARSVAGDPLAMATPSRSPSLSSVASRPNDAAAHLPATDTK